jgi:hypothetical protein
MDGSVLAESHTVESREVNNQRAHSTAQPARREVRRGALRLLSREAKERSQQSSKMRVDLLMQSREVKECSRCSADE